jgi:hypothetical protein
MVCHIKVRTYVDPQEQGRICGLKMEKVMGAEEN